MATQQTEAERLAERKRIDAYIAAKRAEIVAFEKKKKAAAAAANPPTHWETAEKKAEKRRSSWTDSIPGLSALIRALGG